MVARAIGPETFERSPAGQWFKASR